MTTQTARIVVALVVTLAGLLTTPLAGAQGSGHRSSSSSSSSSYGWPVKPFHRQHPVRGFFGDPRIAEDGHGTTHSFHFGIDISCPDGTPVYATLSGRVVLDRVHRETVSIVGADGNPTFSYWHVVPSVRDGQVAVAFRTVVGHVAKGWAHVHFSESRNGIYLNPLRVGALEPYADATRPHVKSLRVERGSRTPRRHSVLGHVRSRRRGVRHDADADRGTVARQARHPGRAAVAAEGIAGLADGRRRAVDDPGRRASTTGSSRSGHARTTRGDAAAGTASTSPMISTRGHSGTSAPSRSGRSTRAATRRRESSRSLAVGGATNRRTGGAPRR